MNDPASVDFEQSSPFRLKGLMPATGRAWLDRLLFGAAERVLGLTKMDIAYRALGRSDGCDEFIAKVCAALDLKLRFPEEELNYIPDSGPLVVVANHPFGGIEGLLLAGLLRRVRKDVRVLTNFLLRRIPALSDLFIGVDPFDGPRARNASGLRQAVRWLGNGGVLLVFPAGEVSHWHLSCGAVTDPSWHPGVARLVHMTQAAVTPIYLYGSNGPLFQMAGLVHPRLRTALLAREVLNKSNTRVALRIGRPLAYSELKHLEPQSLIRFLRLHTYLLGAMNQELEVPRRVVSAPQTTPESCIREVAMLPASQRLADAGDLAVYVAHAAQIPELLREIGRQRELAFRAVGEGTGRETDLDEYDTDYLHLFVWDGRQAKLAGGYRLGLTDHILERRGPKGLYTRTLFRMKKRLFRDLGPAIELGRSFVCADYQRCYAPLMLLWKGIGAFITRHPHYRVLFGPVSISNDYAPVSRQLMVDYLESALLDRQLARWVKPRKRLARSHVHWHKSDLATLGDIENISSLVAEVEPDGKGVPVLLRQYLKLGGRILGFNVDPLFNHSIDALIVVDLTCCELRTLQRYMGKQEALDYLARHEPLHRAA